MAGRLLRENRWIEGAVGQGSAQAQAAAAVMLSGGDREVTVVCVRARPALLSCEVQTDGVAVQGTVEFAALYLTEEGALRQRGAQAGFTAVIPVPGAGPKMRARVLVTAAEETAREQDGRMELGAVLRLEGLVTQGAERALARDIQADGEMAVRTASLPLLRPEVHGQTNLAVAENFPLDDEAFTRVALFEARPEVQQVLPGDGQVVVAGEVAVDSLLAGADAAAPVGWQREVIPFSVEVADDGFTAQMQVTATARVRDLVSEVVFNADDEQEGNLHIEYVLEVTADGLTAEDVPVLADAYPLSEEPFRAQTAQVDYLRAMETHRQEQQVAVQLELPAEAPALQSIVGAFVSPAALELTPGDGAMRSEGLLRVTLLYRAPGREGLACHEQEAPFGADWDAIPAGAQACRMEITGAQAERQSPTQAQVRVALRMEALEAVSGSGQVLEDVAFEGEPVQLPAGAVLYYPEPGQTLWDVARRYRVSEEALRARNPDGKAPLLVYRRLTGF